MKLECLALAAILASSPVAAQEWQVARERFPFAGSRLTIHVQTSQRGTLRVIRGGPGAVRVASRAEQGFTAAGLSEDEELTLTASGQGPVDYMVSVPENVWIDVRLPGHSFAESIAGSTRSRTFEWISDPDRRNNAPPVWVPPANEESVYTTYTRSRAPRVVSVPSLNNVRSLGIRIQDGPFRVRTSRPLSVERGADDLLEIRADAPPMHVVITVPMDTPEFQLRAAGARALVVRGDSVSVLCTAVTDQRLSHGRRWLTFTPTNGTLACQP